MILPRPTLRYPRHRRHALAVLLLGIMVSGAAHTAPYRFANEDYLTEASAFTGWAETLARYAEQREVLLDCERVERGCKGRLRSFKRVLAKGAGLSREEQVQLVNFYINRTRYKDDRAERLYAEDGTRLGLKRNHWGTLYEFLTQRGDCEDYAVAKYFMLRELGFPADDMRVVVTWERREPGYHAVLALRMKNGEPKASDAVWILETDNTIRRKRHSGYRYIYAMNEHAVWDHRTEADLARTQRR